MKADGIYEYVLSDKINLKRYQNRLDDLIHNAVIVLKETEQLMKRALE